MGSSGSSFAATPAYSCSQPAEETGPDFHDNYILGSKLGRGSFAEVYATKEIHDDSVQASNRKAVKVSNRRTQESKKALLLEEKLWMAVGHHENCVRLYEVFHDESLSYMVMERCDCSLHHHIKNIPDLTERTLGPILSQMLQSLHQVHTSHVVHRDIKPDNFLVGGADGQTVKLCDFGLSARLLEGSRKLSNIAGTAPYMCPEMLLGKGYDFKADVWSVGVIAYAFLFGSFPYTAESGSRGLMKKAIAGGVSPTFIPVERHTISKPSHQRKLRLLREGCGMQQRHTTKGSQFRTSTALDFVRSLLSRQPEQRPSAMAARSMKYMTSVTSGSHALSVDLPSLKPMISSAQEVGAFDVQDVRKQAEIDIALRNLQMERHQEQLFKRHPASTSRTSRTDSKDTLSDSMSMPSTACPSEYEPRTTSKASVESRYHTEV